MKRMIDYKEFYNLQQLAKANEQRLDFIEGAYTYSALSLDDAVFDHLLPSAPEDLLPQTLRIGDTVYIEGVAATLDADMIKEIFDSNLVILDCGNSSEYPKVILQRQYVDEESEALSPRNARFKAFVTYGVALYEYTMTVAEYDATAQAGGYIVISCKEACIKPLYYHPIAIYSKAGAAKLGTSFSLVVLNQMSSSFTLETFISWLEESNISYLSPCSGSIYDTSANKRLIIAWVDVSYSDGSVTALLFRGHYADESETYYLRQFFVPIADVLANMSLSDSGVNKIN